MEILKQSIQNLAAPICDTYKIEMAWFRSTLIAPEGAH